MTLKYETVNSLTHQTLISYLQQIRQIIMSLTIFNNLFRLRAAPASCIRVPPLPDRLVGMAGITGIAFFRPEACRRTKYVLQK